MPTLYTISVPSCKFPSALMGRASDWAGGWRGSAVTRRGVPKFVRGRYADAAIVVVAVVVASTSSS
eukprot:2848673-Pyramimonas_sp.AAC.1